MGFILTSSLLVSSLIFLIGKIKLPLKKELNIYSDSKDDLLCNSNSSFVLIRSEYYTNCDRIVKDGYFDHDLIKNIGYELMLELDENFRSLTLVTLEKYCNEQESFKIGLISRNLNDFFLSNFKDSKYLSIINPFSYQNIFLGSPKKSLVFALDLFTTFKDLDYVYDSKKSVHDYVCGNLIYSVAKYPLSFTLFEDISFLFESERSILYWLEYCGLKNIDHSKMGIIYTSSILPPDQTVGNRTECNVNGFSTNKEVDLSSLTKQAYFNGVYCIDQLWKLGLIRPDYSGQFHFASPLHLLSLFPKSESIREMKALESNQSLFSFEYTYEHQLLQQMSLVIRSFISGKSTPEPRSSLHIHSLMDYEYDSRFYASKFDSTLQQMVLEEMELLFRRPMLMGIDSTTQEQIESDILDAIQFTQNPFIQLSMNLLLSQSRAEFLFYNQFLSIIVERIPDTQDDDFRFLYDFKVRYSLFLALKNSMFPALKNLLHNNCALEQHPHRSLLCLEPNFNTLLSSVQSIFKDVTQSSIVFRSFIIAKCQVLKELRISFRESCAIRPSIVTLRFMPHPSTGQVLAYNSNVNIYFQIFVLDFQLPMAQAIVMSMKRNLKEPIANFFIKFEIHTIRSVFQGSNTELYRHMLVLRRLTNDVQKGKIDVTKLKIQLASLKNLFHFRPAFRSIVPHIVNSIDHFCTHDDLYFVINGLDSLLEFKLPYNEDLENVKDHVLTVCFYAQRDCGVRLDSSIVFSPSTKAPNHPNIHSFYGFGQSIRSFLSLVVENPLYNFAGSFSSPGSNLAKDDTTPSCESLEDLVVSIIQSLQPSLSVDIESRSFDLDAIPFIINKLETFIQQQGVEELNSRAPDSLLKAIELYQILFNNILYDWVDGHNKGSIFGLGTVDLMLSYSQLFPLTQNVRSLLLQKEASVGIDWNYIQDFMKFWDMYFMNYIMQLQLEFRNDFIDQKNKLLDLEAQSLHCMLSLESVKFLIENLKSHFSSSFHTTIGALQIIFLAIECPYFAENEDIFSEFLAMLVTSSALYDIKLSSLELNLLLLHILDGFRSFLTAQGPQVPVSNLLGIIFTFQATLARSLGHVYHAAFYYKRALGSPVFYEDILNRQGDFQTQRVSEIEIEANVKDIEILSPTIHIVTCATKLNREVELLKETADLFGLELKLLCMDEPSFDFSVKTKNYKRFLFHSSGSEATFAIRDNDVVLLIDAYDVVLFRHLKQYLKEYFFQDRLREPTSAPILVCGEHGIYPEITSVQLYPFKYYEKSDLYPKKYINSGCIAGTGKALRHMFAQMMATSGRLYRDDQLSVVRYSLQYPDMVTVPTNRLFFTGFKSTYIFGLESKMELDGSFYLDSKPVGLLHANARSSNPIFEAVLKYLNITFLSPLHQLEEKQKQRFVQVIRSLADGNISSGKQLVDCEEKEIRLDRVTYQYCLSMRNILSNEPPRDFP